MTRRLFRPHFTRWPPLSPPSTSTLPLSPQSCFFFYIERGALRADYCFEGCFLNSAFLLQLAPNIRPVRATVPLGGQPATYLRGGTKAAFCSPAPQASSTAATRSRAISKPATAPARGAVDAAAAADGLGWPVVAVRAVVTKPVVAASASAAGNSCAAGARLVPAPPKVSPFASVAVVASAGAGSSADKAEKDVEKTRSDK